jgi:hypothetical protein
MAASNVAETSALPLSSSAGLVGPCAIHPRMEETVTVSQAVSRLRDPDTLPQAATTCAPDPAGQPRRTAVEVCEDVNPLFV